MQVRDVSEIVFTNGALAPLDPRFTECLVKNNRFQLFMLSSISLFGVLQPYQPVILQRWQAISIIAASGALVFAIYIGAFYVFSRFHLFHVRRLRAGCGNLNSRDKWIFRARAA